MTRRNAKPVSMAARIDRILNDDVLGFLALVSLFLGLAPAGFMMTPYRQAGVTNLEIIILIIFAVEYCAGFIDASDKKAFVRNPWRVLDALIIVAGVLSLMPAISNLLRNTPALRLIRFARLALFGTRTGNAIVAHVPPPEVISRDSDLPLEAIELINKQAPHFKAVSWTEVLERIHSAAEDWLLVSNLGLEKIRLIAGARGTRACIAIRNTRVMNATQCKARGWNEEGGARRYRNGLAHRSAR